MLFKDLNLTNPLLNALADLGFSEPTPIQEKVFAPVMSGKDILGIAQTGTGKTYAYLLPLIRQWNYSKKKTPEILILVPTRELVEQLVEECRKLTTYTAMAVTGVYGGTNMKTQILSINSGVDMVVATPGRLIDLIMNGTIQAKQIKKLVIDEVDEMLNLGFRSQLNNLLDLLPPKRQTLMFSATITEEVEAFIETNFNNPLKIEAAATGTRLSNITQIAYAVPNFNTKVNLLAHLLATDKTMTKVLVFAGSKRLADFINSKLELLFPDQLAVIHSNKAQNTRFQTVEAFEDGTSRILIASDLVARGLDVTEVSHVINMDIPDAPENYMHRIGRTGRADKKGIAINLIAEADTEAKLRVEELMGYEIPMKTLPAEVEISAILTPDEETRVHMKIIEVRQLKVIPKGPSHHEKKEKNQKVNIKVSRADSMKQKYGSKYTRER